MNNATSLSKSQGGLFSKVSLLLTGSLGLAAAGSYVGAGIESGAVLIGLLVLFFVGGIGVRFAARSSKQLGLLVLGGWTFITGMMMGPMISHYVGVLGWQEVFLAFVGTAGVMAGCGAIGALSGRDFSNMGKYLFAGLLVMIVVGLVNIFFAFSSGVEILYTLVGMGLFAGFFIFDFFRLSKAENNWVNAIDLTVDIFLDFIIFFEYLLRFLAAIASSSNDD